MSHQTSTNTPTPAEFDFSRIDGYSVSLAAFLRTRFPNLEDADHMASQITKHWLPAALDLARCVERNKALREVSDAVIEESYAADMVASPELVVSTHTMHETIAGLRANL